METARKTFEINNGVKVSCQYPNLFEKLTLKEIDPVDSLYLYSKEEEKVLADQEPWATEYAPSLTRTRSQLMIVRHTFTQSRFQQWLWSKWYASLA
jgi:hypothetical protein